MTFFKYLSDKIVSIIFFMLDILLINLVLWFDPFHNIILSSLLYLDILMLITSTVFIVIRYWVDRQWYQKFSLPTDLSTTNLSLPITGAHSNEQQLYQSYINALLSSHQTQLNDVLSKQQEQEDFLNAWIHDIKVPLTAIQLLIETSDGQLSEKQVMQTEIELKKIENFVEQVIYYSRLDSFSNDYLIQDYSLKKIIHHVVRDNMNLFFSKHISFTFESDDASVLTDSKWLRFILNQVITNSLKYTPDNGKITVFISNNTKETLLSIKDTGIGIPKVDLARVFDKGFTGDNGRKYNQNATGLGLYLANNLSQKLGHRLEIDSSIDQGTTVKIIFPKLTYYNDEAGDIFR
ncbi:sensor histidine kinase [Dellaglioa sp. BT-FLS60]